MQRLNHNQNWDDVGWLAQETIPEVALALAVVTNALADMGAPARLTHRTRQKRRTLIERHAHDAREWLLNEFPKTIWAEVISLHGGVKLDKARLIHVARKFTDDEERQARVRRMES